MTEDTDQTADGSEEQAANSMGDVDHTHPERNTTFGSVFGRGPTVAADGGARAGTETQDDGAEASDSATMADVSHESPTETDASGCFDRGGVDPARVDEPEAQFRGVASDE